MVQPAEQHTAILGQLLKSASTAGNLTTDAHLAALAIEHGATVISFNRAFARFEGVQSMLPAADRADL